MISILFWLIIIGAVTATFYAKVRLRQRGWKPVREQVVDAAFDAHDRRKARRTKKRDNQ